MNQHAETRSKSTIETDIHSTRNRLDNTLTALQTRLSPQQLINTTFDYIRHGGPGEFTENLGGSVKNNPVPFLVTAVGLSWLILAQRSGSANGSQVSTAVGSQSSGAQASATSGLSAGKDKAKHAGQQARSGAHNMKTQVRERSARVRDRSQTAIHSASDGARNAGVQMKYFVEENPFAAAAVGIGIGAILGSLFPASRIENERLGEMRDSLVDRASEAGAEQAEKLKEKSREKAHTTGEDSPVTAEKHTETTSTSPTSGTVR